MPFPPRPLVLRKDSKRSRQEPSIPTNRAKRISYSPRQLSSKFKHSASLHPRSIHRGAVELDAVPSWMAKRAVPLMVQQIVLRPMQGRRGRIGFADQAVVNQARPSARSRPCGVHPWRGRAQAREKATGSAAPSVPVSRCSTSCGGAVHPDPARHSVPPRRRRLHPALRAPAWAPAGVHCLLDGRPVPGKVATSRGDRCCRFPFDVRWPVEIFGGLSATLRFINGTTIRVRRLLSGMLYSGQSSSGQSRDVWITRRIVMTSRPALAVME